MLRTARPLSAALILTAGALVLAACGSSDDGGASATSTATATTAAPAVAARHTAQDVAKTVGFKDNGDGTWTSPTGCRVTAILLTHAEVLQQRTSPDALVVTNGADDVGVKFESKAGCREALLANLSQVK